MVIKYQTIMSYDMHYTHMCTMYIGPGLPKYNSGQLVFWPTW